MTIEPSIITSLGDELYDALIAGETIPNLRDRNPDIDIVDAYRVQERLVARRLETGEAIIGKKIGVTSKVVQEMIGVFEPDFGQLTDAMLVADDATVERKSLIQPKAEGEIAFILKHDLTGPGVTAADVLEATE
jgi:2-oxopent-4-enoate/cis-2-oxohex-4-enoate hydratase